MGIRESQHGRVVAEIEAVAAPGGRARLGTCSVEGLRLCERALRSGARFERAVVARSFLEDGSERATALRTQLEALVETVRPRGASSTSSPTGSWPA